MRRGFFIPQPVFIAMTLAFVTAGGCAPASFRANHDKVSSMVHQLNASDNGRTVVLRTGETLMVSLPENATTGYRWELDRWDRDLVGLVAEEPRYPSGPLVGAGGQVDFRFQARKPGSGDIAIKEWRHWEGDASVIARYRLHVEVQP